MSDDEELLEQQLVEDIASFTHDPHGYALYAFPWGEENRAARLRRAASMAG